MELEIGVTLSDLALAESWFQSDTSSGYLEDAIVGKDNIRFNKEQKLPFCSKDQKVDSFPSCSTTSQQPLHGDWKKIAYPFELVKPGGVEGETTLRDINHQILMTPSSASASASKPIPHLVEDSVTHHPCTLARCFGISGKAVVSLTRIPTQGRGSVTIIRTKD